MSIPALPTTFTPASSCLGNTNIWLVYHDNKFNCFSSYACPYYFLQGPLDTSDCLPPNYEDSEDTFHSPGICPSGYTSACTSAQSLGTYAVTVQICCPTGFVFLLPLIFLISDRNYAYSFINTSGFQCQTKPNLYWETTLRCFSQFTTTEVISATATQSDTQTSMLTTVAVGSTDAVNAYAIAIQMSAPSTKANLSRMLSFSNRI
jgi:hypothetical protein